MGVVMVLVAGAGAGAPGVSMCPAHTETENVMLRIIAAHSWRKVFTVRCLL